MKEGWEYKKLGEVCNIDFGTRVVRSRDAGSIYPVYGGGGATFKMDMYNREDCMVISRFGMSEQCTRFVKGKFFLNDSGLTLSMKENCMIQEFMDWQILYLNNTIYSLGRGAAQKNLDTKALAEVRITYPNNLSEQQSNVDYLDSAFAKIDAMKANAEKALNEAKALFQASLKEMLEPKEGWEEKKLSEVVNILNGYAFPSKAFGDNQELKVVKITNVGVGSFIEDISTLPQKMFIQDVCLKEGDIVIALTRTIISEGLKRAIIPSSYDGAMLNQRVASLRFSGKINMSFLYYYLGCSIVSDYVWLHVNTLMQPNLSIKDLKSMPVCIPSLPEQQSIVETLDSLKSKVDRLQENFDKISQECDALKQAILRQVFE